MNVRFMASIAVLAIASVASAQVPLVRNGVPVSHNLPPAQMLMEPGPGVGGPGPGVLAPASYMGAGAVAPGCGPSEMPGYGPAASPTVQILFDKPQGMQVNWDISGVGQYDSAPLVVPGRQNFAHGAIYRLKVSAIEGRPGVELFPTLEIGSASNRTAAYLAHSAVPIQFTQEDFDQVASGNFVTKVIYVPDPDFQELALAGVDTLVSTRLDPGVDPLVEADRRGAILAVIRMGNKDLRLGGDNFGGMMNAGMPGMPGMGSRGDYISGVTGPNYGMPWTGTQIGLPGPAHIPMGGPAGLQQYTMHNHTAMSIPGPTPRVNVHVKQKPGLSYPRPADTVMIQEHTIRPPHANTQPPADMVQGQIPENCPPNGVLGRLRR
ncbi:MAG: hypothetical protein R3C03_06630 [Pirellulaceae bacterium]